LTLPSVARISFRHFDSSFRRSGSSFRHFDSSFRRSNFFPSLRFFFPSLGFLSVASPLLSVTLALLSVAQISFSRSGSTFYCFRTLDTKGIKFMKLTHSTKQSIPSLSELIHKVILLLNKCKCLLIDIHLLTNPHSLVFLLT